MSTNATAAAAAITTPTGADALGLFYPAADAAYGCQDPAHLVVGNGFVRRD